VWGYPQGRESAFEQPREIGSRDVLLGHERNRSALGESGLSYERGIGRSQDDPEVAVVVGEPPRQRQPVCVGKLNIDQGRVRASGIDGCQGLRAVRGLCHDVAPSRLQQRAHEGSETGVVVDDQDSCRHRVLPTEWMTATGAAMGITRSGSVADMGVRVVVGDDEPLVREGIVHVLERAGFEVVGVAGDAPDLIRKTKAHKPEVVITDIQMPPDGTDDGLRAAIEIRESMPEIGVVVLSQFLEDRYPLELVGDRAEGVGYLLKERVGDLKLFADSVRRVAAGGSALDPRVVERMVGRRRASSPLDELTPRERQVMALMAEGRSNGGIAAELIVTVPAVERHVTSIFDKLGLRQVPEDHRRVLAVLEYLKRTR
jgi:DNA-binding NarL/FixJ family response regulator